MKSLLFPVLILLFPAAISAQNIHGLWSGTLVNDSTHRTQNFELGLSEYRGKITGYTYTTFIDNDTFYYSIKRVKAERKEGKLIIQDEEMVGNNFPERAAKHVKQVTIFPLVNDTTIDISAGRWNTNQTKKYYSIGGSATIRAQEDQQRSDLLAHLQEANIKSDLSAPEPDEKKMNGIATVATYTPSRKSEIDDQKIAPKKKEAVTGLTNTKPVQTISDDKSSKDQNAATLSHDNKETAAPATKDEHKESIPDVVRSSKQPVIKNNGNPAVPAKNNPVPDKPFAQVKPMVKKDTLSTAIHNKDEATGKNEKKVTETSSVAINTPISQRKESIQEKKELPAIVSNRKNENIQDIYFKNDSLVLSLYDNGIVDGDTVSVFLNGETIIAKQMLKTVATKKTIYISERMDSVQLVLFAENLGSIPPNTGLLTVRDGDEVYQVRFSADLQKNASITLRRKK